MTRTPKRPQARRAPNKMGSVYKRPDGRWAAQVRLGVKADGKPNRPTVYGKTDTEVIDKLKVLLYEETQGVAPKSGRLTVAQFLTDWLQNVARVTVKPATYVSYEAFVRVHIVPALGGVVLAKLTPQDVQKLMAAKLASGDLSARSTNYIRSVLRRALTHAVRWGLVSRNAASQAEPLPQAKPKISPFTPDQASRLIECAQTHRLCAAFELALATGLRRGELLGLRWKDVDMDAGALTVRVTLQRVNGQAAWLEPKTEASQRTVALPASLIARLRSHKAAQNAERRLSGVDWANKDLVFTNRSGGPMLPRNFDNQYQLLLRRAGLPHRRVHDLRHTAASLMLAAGIPLHIVSKTLGHTSISMTANFYGHLYDSDRQKVADVMDDFLIRARQTS